MILGYHTVDPTFFSIRNPFVHGFTDLSKIIFFFMSVDPSPISTRKRNWQRCKKFFLLESSVYASPRAPPLPILTITYQPGTHRIALYVFNKRNVICISLYRKRLIPSLIEVPASDRPRSCVYLPSVFVREVMHKKTKISIFLGIQQEVPVIGHNGVRKNAHINQIFGIKKKLFE